jgi:hypothetical protein
VSSDHPRSPFTSDRTSPHSVMTDPTFQAHELVYCAKCFLPYDQQVNITEEDIPDDASSRSWYLTNCGHTLCSQCIFPNGGTRISFLHLIQAPSPLDDNTKYTCPKCERTASIVGLAAEVSLFSPIFEQN